MKLAKDAVMPDIPELKYIDNSEFDTETEFTFSGYPEQTLGADK